MPPPRKRFQIHLSTAIVMMFVAGGLMWANIRGDHVKESDYMHVFKVDWLGFTEAVYGWPCDAMQLATHVNNREGGGIIGPTPHQVEWRQNAVVVNALVAFAILVLVWFLCEWQIRRRVARKGA